MIKLAVLFITVFAITLFVVGTVFGQTSTPTMSPTISPSVSPSPTTTVSPRVVVPSGAPATGHGV